MNKVLKTAVIIVVLLAAGVGAWFFSKEEPQQQVNNVEESPSAEGQSTIEENIEPVSIPGMRAKEYLGSDLVLGQVLDDNVSYTRYYITYNSNGLKISGIMNVPKGQGPFPVLFLNHGYIDPAIYTNGRGLRREQDYLARQGFVVIHSDYRNHASSDKDPNADVNFRLGYVEDVINGIMAVKNSSLPYFDKENIGMLGHSMGGGVAWNVMVVKPELVKAFVQFAPVSVDAKDNFERWIVRRPETAQKILELHGDSSQNPSFWQNVSPVNFLDSVRSPVLLHHGTADADVPIEWSGSAAAKFNELNKAMTYHVYPGQPHEFTSSWGLVMQRTTEFFKEHLK